MESIDNKAIKIKLEQEIEKTKQSIIDYKDMSVPEGLDDAVGRISRMDAINNKSITLAALRQAEQKLIKLKHVLSQIDTVGFGLCTKCKKSIPIGRIILMPQSSHCVNCAK